jgi:ribosomal-protein-alanine N-acetyltransferase
MSQADAEAIASWRYPEPFSFYDWTADADDLAELLDAALRGDAYFAADDDSGGLVGYFSFKKKGGGTLEVGLGLHPDRTGQGLGASFLAQGLAYARRRFAPERFTLAVASFNMRAIKVYERAGFTRVRAYMHSTNGGEWEFLEMGRSA